MSISPHLNPHSIVHELAFLRQIDVKGQDVFYRESVLLDAIRRYEVFWTELIAHVSQGPEDDLNFAPPLDVHWVWHCHMLCPTTYRSDLSDHSPVGRPINHMPRSQSRLRELRTATRSLWEKMFPDEPFDSQEMDNLKIVNHQTQFEYDIAAAVQRQKVFFYQVSLPHYLDTRFLENAIRRYKMYLKLKRLNPQQFLVPCYDIDIAWHTHQVCPYIYAEDTRAILGDILPHDDSVNDRSPGSKLCQSDQITRELWKNTFGEDFSSEGSMYRGQPPQGKLHPLFESYLRSCHVGKVQAVRFKEVRFFSRKEFKEKSSKKNNYFLNVFVSNVNSESEDVVLRRHPKSKPVLSLKGSFCDDLYGKKTTLVFKASKTEGDKKCIRDRAVLLRKFSCSAIEMEILKVPVKAKSGFLKLFQGSGIKEINAARHPLRLDKYQDGVHSFQVDCFGGSYLKGSVSISEEQRENMDVSLSIVEGSFYDCVIPENVESLWGPIPLERLPDGVENNCKAVTHQIVDQSGQKIFSVYLLHSLPLEMSAIQVFVGDKMCVVAHLVASDTLSKRIAGIGLDDELERKPWRGMLIKDNKGDWGICVAAWLGMRPGQPGVPASRSTRGKVGIPGKPGYFKMFFLNLRTHESHSIVLPEGFTTIHMRRYWFALPGIEVDLENGTILVKKVDEGGTFQMPQLVALAFATSMLYLLVQPTPADMDEAAIKNFRLHDRGTVKVRPMYMDAAELAFLGYVGWKLRSNIATNSTLRHHCGRGLVAGCLAGIGGPATALGAGVTAAAAMEDASACGGCGGCGGGCGAGDFGGFSSGWGGGGEGGWGGDGGFDFGIFSDGGLGGGGDGGGDGGGCGGCGGCGG